MNDNDDGPVQPIIAPVVGDSQEAYFPLRFHDDDVERVAYLAQHSTQVLTIIERLWCMELYLRSLTFLFTDNPMVANVVVPSFLAERAAEMKRRAKKALAINKEAKPGDQPMVQWVEYDVEKLFEEPGRTILSKLGVDVDAILQAHKLQKATRDRRRFACSCSSCQRFRASMGASVAPTAMQ